MRLITACRLLDHIDLDDIKNTDNDYQRTIQRVEEKRQVARGETAEVNRVEREEETWRGGGNEEGEEASGQQQRGGDK